MDLHAKIIEIYPDLIDDAFHPMSGSILIQDDSDGFGPYIAKWEHEEYECPTDEELGITRKPALIDVEPEVVEEAPVIIDVVPEVIDESGEIV